MNAYRSFGLFGLVLLLFGLLAGVITSSWTSRYVLVHLIFGGALLALYLFTHIESLKESVSGRKTKYGTNTIVYTVLTLGVLGFINYIGYQHAWRYDTTEQGMFSVAPQTRQILEGLDRDIEVSAFFREAEGTYARDILESFSNISERFSFRMVDPDRRPELTQEMEVTQYGTLVMTSGEDSTKITEVTEEGLTNALIRFTSADRKRIYFATGHGEPDLEQAETDRDFGQLEAALENEGFEVESILLASIPEVPDDADVLIITATERPFLEQEIAALDRYLDRGGRAFFMIDPRAGGELIPLLEARGIAVGTNVVVDQVMQLFAGPSLGVQPIVSDYGFHPITEEFGERTIFLLVRTVDAAAEMPGGITVTPLARTSANSWAEADIERLFGANEAVIDDDDLAGPVSIAVAATITPASATDPEGRIVVFGDSEWVDNSNLSLYYNQDLFLNSVSWLAGEADLISIRPRATRASRIVLTESESWSVFYISVLLLPEIVLLAGLFIWWRRRR
jgi:ABC-type uncharacterized transport system involved in gliding motility auxiliary subunit